MIRSRLGPTMQRRHRQRASCCHTSGKLFEPGDVNGVDDKENCDYGKFKKRGGGGTPTRPLLNLKSFHIQLWFLFVMMCVFCFYDDVDFYLNVQEWTWNKAWIFCSFSTKIFASLLWNSIDINPRTFHLKMNQCRRVFILQITKIICQTILISILRYSNMNPT